MSSKEQTHHNEAASSKGRLSKPIANHLKTPVPQIHPPILTQRAQLAPRSLTQSDVLQLQRTVGNQVVSNLLSGAQPRPVMQAQPRPNHTGLPDGLRSAIESLSGIDLSDIRVHANSDRPAQFNALAYAQGTHIHIAPGQEQYLPHEAWHVVQQAQGRVQPTMQMKDKVSVNDDEGLEHEADVMGAKALSYATQATGESLEDDRADASTRNLRLQLRSREIIQLGRGGKDDKGGKGGKGGDEPAEKLKGDDYANNVQKLVDDIAGLLQASGLGVFADEAVNDPLGIINNNRSKCSVITSLVEGEDVNTAAYGALKSSITEALAPAANLFGESDKKYFVSEIRAVVARIEPLLDRLAATAVDPRVAAVIQAGKGGDARAMAAINEALPRLAAALKARLKAYFKLMFDRNFPPARKDEGGGPPPGGGMGGAIEAY